MQKNKIGVLCDMHLPADNNSPQYFFLKKALQQMKRDGVTTVFCLGDITGYGEIEAWNLYCEALKDFTHYEVLGNSDVRDTSTRYMMESLIPGVEFMVGTRHVIGINTPEGEISCTDRKRLEHTKDGDIIFLHHYVQSLKEESRAWLTKLAGKVALTIVHGHGHRSFDYYINHTHVLGFRGLDPDKAIGTFPSFHYLHVKEDKVTVQENFVILPKAFLQEVADYFGIACADNKRDLIYAAEHSIKYAEIRCKGEKGKEWDPELDLVPVVENWRKKTGGYLSVHMPNLKFQDGVINGKEKWLQALDYAILLGADSITMHPPRVPVCDMPKNGIVWQEFLEMYTAVAKRVPATMKLGVENMHKNSNEVLDETRGFGYRPEEILVWIDAINEVVGADRVGHVLDVGHARNNGAFAKKYPIGRWYSIMGNKTIAYHIHQVVPVTDGLKNHCGIENWFGPMINYTSFFYEWHHNVLNHVPVFLEVRGWEQFDKSMKAFRVLIESMEENKLCK